MKKLLLPFILFLSIGILFNACQQKELEQLNPETVITNNLKGMSIEELSDIYFGENPDELSNKENLIGYVNLFYATLGSNEHFSNKKPCFIQPIYAYGIDGVAYYEIWFTEDDKTTKGWLLISTTDKDYPIVNFSMGIPYSYELLDSDPSTKVYRFGVTYFTAEKEGQKIGEYGAMPTTFVNPNTALSGGSEVNTLTGYEQHSGTDDEPIEGRDFYTIDSYESLKQVFPTNYYTEQRKSNAKEMQTMLEEQAFSRDPYEYHWVGGAKAYFTQIPKNTSPNNYNCASGCNNNAWANVYAWWDRNKGKSNLIPTTSTGETSPLRRDTPQRQAVVDPVQMSVRSHCKTSCSGGDGLTLWRRMNRGYRYAPSKGYGYNYAAQWCELWDGCDSDLANIIVEGIANRREPVVVGAKHHIYVGIGLAQQPNNTNATWAYCYPGWRENDTQNVWIHWKDFDATTRITIY